jgi:hypothetical protein
LLSTDHSLRATTLSAGGYRPDSGHTVALSSSDTSTSFALRQSSAASDVGVAATTQALCGADLVSGQLTTGSHANPTSR